MAAANPYFTASRAIGLSCAVGLGFGEWALLSSVRQAWQLHPTKRSLNKVIWLFKASAGPIQNSP